MGPADKVFANLRDIHELDDVSYLTDEQREMIRRFFSNFTDDHNSELKERFLRLWSHIGDIYRDYNERLASQQLAYEGALYRQVATDETIQFEYDAYVFIGFNHLHQVEQTLFRRLDEAGKAVFYQDTDELPPRDVTFISAPTENIQARYISQWLTPERIADGRRTAIVLCNEGLLQAVVHCLPDEVDKVNVTTGYPLLQTPVASLISQLLNLPPPDIPTTAPYCAGSSSSSAPSPLQTSAPVAPSMQRACSAPIRCSIVSATSSTVVYSASTSSPCSASSPSSCSRPRSPSTENQPKASR